MSNQTIVKDAVHGLSCPRCGGMVPIPEGQVIVICPYCDQRSVVAAARTAPIQPPAAQAPIMPPASALPGASQEQKGPEQPRDLVKSMVQTVISAGTTEYSDSQNDLNNSALGDIGIRRYQAPLKINRDQAVGKLKEFLSGKVQVARDAAAQSELREAFLVHLPFWAVWGRGVAYAFGQVKVGSGDHERYEPREKKTVREMTWNSPACEVGEFGVRQIGLDGCPMLPFSPEELHRTGMVFEPVGAEQAALEAARASFNEQIRGELKMDRTAQVFTRLTRTRLGLLYYPLWVLRYLYRGRSFQVVVDGVTGQVLYGKAPGSVAYRAAMLVGGMAVGSVVTIDIPAMIMMSSTNSSSDDNPFVFALIVFVVGLGILWAAYRTFRYAEHYEYHRFGAPKGAGLLPVMNLPGNLREASDAIRALKEIS